MVAWSGILELTNRLVQECQPDRVILFGSHAYGTAREHSDVDLLVIMPFEGDAFDKAYELHCRIKPAFAFDLLVGRPADTQRRYAQFDPLIREALDRGRVLYERNS